MSSRLLQPRWLFCAALAILPAATSGAQTADTSFHEPSARPSTSELTIDLPEPELDPMIPATVAFLDSTQPAELDPGSSHATGPAPVRPAATAEGLPEPTPPLPEPPEPAPQPAVPAPQPTAAELGVDRRWPEAARESGGVVANRQVIAYYGHPRSRYMGVLGEQPIEEMTRSLLQRAAEYDDLNGDIGVAPAFHMIYGTVYEDGSVGILRENKLLEYIEYAADHDILVFLDHQIGNGSVTDAVTMMLPYLRFEHVNLAIDPEWATPIPGREIGHVSAQDINDAQQLMQDYLEENDIPGTRMLVVHQFNWRMITDRDQVRADFPRILLIHDADGFGQPAQKRDSWNFNVLATNLPLKGFKLFYPKSWRDGGYDDPLMTPAQVLQLDPVPVYVQYQ